VRVGFVVVGFVALVGVLGVLAWRAHQKRLAAMRALADELGFTFDPGDDHGHDEEYAQFAIFQRGHSRRAFATLRGAVELFGQRCPAVAGDFSYKETSGSGKNRSTTTYTFSYVIVHPPWPSPSLVVRPEGVFDKLKGAFGFDDIDFESEQFSRAFWVESDDKRFAYDVLHPRMMEFLLAERPPMLEIDHGALCLADGSRRWDPETFRARLHFVARFCKLWPRHLLKELQG
jgi:hypothetical protein